ncbi:MAG: hypothetical protein ABI380_03825 [Edaphobacter sp.]
MIARLTKDILLAAKIHIDSIELTVGLKAGATETVFGQLDRNYGKETGIAIMMIG